MYKVVFIYDDGTMDEIYTTSIDEVEEYEKDDDFAYVEVVY